VSSSSWQPLSSSGSPWKTSGSASNSKPLARSPRSHPGRAPGARHKREAGQLMRGC
jgi:hypothetical protein